MKGNFQTILIGIFMAFFIFAVLIFSGLLPIGKSNSSKSAPTGKVVIWGTFPGADIAKVFDNLNTKNRNLIISYTQKNSETYQSDLIKSFAAGNGPDIFIMSDDMVLPNKDFTFVLPFANYPQKTFNDGFFDGAEAFISNEGVLGLPILVDPIVLYYNKDLLANEGIAKPPEYWDELFDLNAKLTKKKNDGTISQSMIALGTYDNITHAKDILSLLLIQGGNPIISRSGDKILATLSSNFKLPTSPAEAVLAFFSEFSNQNDQAYSWNRGLLESRDMFTSGKLAFYVGRASELFYIQSVNPNLSFDVAPILQTRGTNVKRTYAKVYALAINKKSTNSGAAFGVAGLLSNGDDAKDFAQALSLPPASRSLLANAPTDPYLFTFFNSAIISRTWLDPSFEETNDIFKEMIQNVLSNKLSASDSVSKAQSRLSALLNK